MGVGMAVFEVRAHWDAEAKVWWAESQDLPGLVAEAGSHDELVADLRAIIPDLVSLNLPGLDASSLSFNLISDQVEHLRAA